MFIRLINNQTTLTEMLMCQSAEFKISFPKKRQRNPGTRHFIDLNRTTWKSETIPAGPELSRDYIVSYKKHCTVPIPLGRVQLLKIVLLVSLLSSSEDISKVTKSYIILWDLQIWHHMKCLFSLLQMDIQGDVCMLKISVSALHNFKGHLMNRTMIW